LGERASEGEREGGSFGSFVSLCMWWVWWVKKAITNRVLRDIKIDDPSFPPKSFILL
jgi:hypothetical protein